MTAVSTALRTLAWAADPAGPPPVGSLRQIGALARPDEAALAAVRGFAATTSARLGAGTPPLGDSARIGLGTLLLAAVIGGRLEAEPATALLDAVPPVTLTDKRGWAECLVRHGVVGPVLAEPPEDAGERIPEPLADALRRASPLTAVLHHPSAGSASAAARTAATRLTSRPHGTGLLVAALAAPSSDADVLTWRAELLELFRHEHRAVALEIYIAALLWHGAGWAERIRWAGRELAGFGRPDELPIATLRYWTPLARLYRDEQALAGAGQQPDQSPATIARSVFLRPADFAPVLRLIDRHRLMAQGTAA